MNENDRTVDLEEEELSGIDDLSLFNAKDLTVTIGSMRHPFGMAPELEFIIEDFLLSGILGMVVATGGSGKTMFLTQLAYCVASGRNSWECGRSSEESPLRLCRGDQRGNP